MTMLYLWILALFSAVAPLPLVRTTVSTNQLEAELESLLKTRKPAAAPEVIDAGETTPDSAEIEQILAEFSDKEIEVLKKIRKVFILLKSVQETKSESVPTNLPQDLLRFLPSNYNFKNELNNPEPVTSGESRVLEKSDIIAGAKESGETAASTETVLGLPMEKLEREPRRNPKFFRRTAESMSVPFRRSEEES